MQVNVVINYLDMKATESLSVLPTLLFLLNIFAFLNYGFVFMKLILWLPHFPWCLYNNVCVCMHVCVAKEYYIENRKLEKFSYLGSEILNYEIKETQKVSISISS